MKANINTREQLIAAALCPSVTIVEVTPAIAFPLYRANYNEAYDTLEWYDYDNEYLEGRPVKVTTLSETAEDLENYIAEFDHPMDKLFDAISNLAQVTCYGPEDGVFFNKAIYEAAEATWVSLEEQRHKVLRDSDCSTMYEYGQKVFDEFIMDYLQQQLEDENVEPIEVQIESESDLRLALRNGLDVYVGAHWAKPYLKDDKIYILDVEADDEIIDSMLYQSETYASFKAPRKYRKQLTEHRYNWRHNDYFTASLALSAMFVKF